MVLSVALLLVWLKPQLQVKPGSAKDTVLQSSSPANIRQSAIDVNNTKVTQNDLSRSLTKPAADNPLTIQAKSSAIPNAYQQPITTAQTAQTDADDFLESRINASKAWLETSPANTVTLQIMTITDDGQLNSQIGLLKNELDVEKLYLYRKNQPENSYTAVLYGAFSQREDALNAMALLPEAIKNNNPQIRTVGGINRDIQQKQ
jgi:septal ring-binding cell division protein DamX